MRWSLHKYKCLWGVGGKGWGSSFQEGVSHTYTPRLDYSRISILYKKESNKIFYYFLFFSLKNYLLFSTNQTCFLFQKYKKKKTLYSQKQVFENKK